MSTESTREKPNRSEWQAAKDLKLEPMEQARRAQPIVPPAPRFSLKVGTVLKIGSAVLVLAGLWSAGIVQAAFALTVQAFFG